MGGGGGGAASAFDIGGVRIAIAGGGGGADGEWGYNGGNAATYNIPDSDVGGWGNRTYAQGQGGASKIPAKGYSTADYEILDVTAGYSDGGYAGISWIGN
jgi:hypothetical protein